MKIGIGHTRIHLIIVKSHYLRANCSQSVIDIPHKIRRLAIPLSHSTYRFGTNELPFVHDIHWYNSSNQLISLSSQTRRQFGGEVREGREGRIGEREKEIPIIPLCRELQSKAKKYRIRRAKTFIGMLKQISENDARNMNMKVRWNQI